MQRTSQTASALICLAVNPAASTCSPCTIYSSTVKRVKERFWINDAGKINLSVRYGSKTLELAKGKNPIELATGEELIAVF